MLSLPTLAANPVHSEDCGEELADRNHSSSVCVSDEVTEPIIGKNLTQMTISFSFA